MPEKDVIMLITSGLREEYNNLKPTLIARQPPVTLLELPGLLADHEYLTKKDDPIIPAAAQAFTATPTRASTSPNSLQLPPETVQSLQQLMTRLGFNVQPAHQQNQVYYSARGQYNRDRGSYNCRGRGSYNNNNRNMGSSSGNNSKFACASNQNTVYGSCNRCGIGHVPSQCPNRDPATIRQPRQAPQANFADHHSQASSSWLPDTGANIHVSPDLTGFDNSEPYLVGTKFRINQLEAHQVAAYHEKERQYMLQFLEKYKQTCLQTGVCAEVHYIEMDSIEKGIVEFILQHDVRRLVMGGAADKHYSKKMVDLKSKKAIYVRLVAAPSCQIQFICKGNIIFTRLGRLNGAGVSISSPSSLPNTNSDSGESSFRSRSVIEGQSTILQLNSPTQDYRRVMSDNRGTRISPPSSVKLTPATRLFSGSAYDEWSGISQRSPSTGSRFSTCSSEMVDDSGLIPYARSEADSDYGSVPRFKDDFQNPSPPSVLQETGMNDELYDQLIQAMAEAGNSKRDAFDESIRRRKAEKDAIEAKRRVKAFENLYSEELRRRREIDEALEKTKEEHENIKRELEEVSEELRMALEQKSLLESQIADSDRTVQDLEQKMFSAVELLQNFKKERDELQVECDNALRLLEEMREKQAEEASCSTASQFYTEFSFSEVKEATRNFDPSLKIGEGGYGSIFRGFIRHTEVAIKMLHSHSMQGPTEFQQEVNVLSRLRHPNLVTLIGACPDTWVIIYEYLSGGSLEDRLNCIDNTPPLSWQNRIRIAAELCSVLIFLHSCAIVHGDLKPANLLLDKNLVTKLSDFGICRVLSQNELTSSNTSLCRRTDPKGTFVYMDPEFLYTGELTSKSDTYSFGIILLRLLTGRPPLGLTKEVQRALNEENLKNILDPTAGDWPFVQAQQLALLAMNCCDVVRKNRPDLASEVWRVLEPMRVSCGLSSIGFGSERQSQIPHYFICPIFQEIMQDPVVAADGFTYEAEALRGWLDSGHNTSPMTNLELTNSNLVPNHALRSAIQEWLQQP